MTSASPPREPTLPPLLGWRLAHGLGVLSGLLYFVGLPGVNGWPAAFVALVPLLLAIEGRSPRGAAAVGMTSGFVMSVTGFSWLLGMFERFSGMSRPVCVALMVATCAYQGGRMALTCWLTARASARGWPAAVAFVLASTTGELLYPLLFPWYFAFMMHRTPLLLQTADLGGVYLAGALLIGPNLALAEVIRSRLSRSAMDRRVVVAGLLAPMLGAVYGAWRMKRVEAMEGEGIAAKVGVVQGNLPLVTREGGEAVHRRLTEKLRDEGANLVVWSEGSVPGVLDGNAAAARVVRDLGVPVIFGASVRGSGGDRRPRNAAFLSDYDGKIVGRYDKHYLLPFGEFIPLGETFPGLYARSPNSGHMAPGTTVAPLVLGGHPITALICYEDILPWFVNGAVRDGRPELLVNLTIDTWFGDTLEPWEHLALAQLRAVEHRRYLVRATNTGVSAIVDPAGRVTARGGLFTEDSFVGPVRMMAPTTVYEVVGDLPFHAGALAILAMALITRRRREA